MLRNVMYQNITILLIYEVSKTFIEVFTKLNIIIINFKLCSKMKWQN